MNCCTFICALLNYASSVYIFTSLLTPHPLPQSVLALAVMSRSSTAPLSEISLSSNETFDLRVRASIPSPRSRSDFASIPTSLISIRPGVYRIGTLSIRGIHPTDPSVTLAQHELAVCAPLVETPMFSLSTNKYALRRKLIHACGCLLNA